MIICEATKDVWFDDGKLLVNTIEIEKVVVSRLCTGRLISFDRESGDTSLHVSHCFTEDGILILSPDEEWKECDVIGRIEAGSKVVVCN